MIPAILHSLRAGLIDTPEGPYEYLVIDTRSLLAWMNMVCIAWYLGKRLLELSSYSADLAM